MKPHQKNHNVAILLCTFQGELYIEDQLASFMEQSYSKWKLFISDDGSRDRTLKIIKRFNFKNKPRPLIFEGPRKGFAANFVDLTRRSSIKATYFAWSDQDDIWQKTKLERAIRWLDSQPSSLPLLYCSRTLLVDHLNRYIEPTRIFKKPKTLENALVQNIAGGNTMVFNKKARQLFLRASVDKTLPAHDWLMYQVVTGCGGLVHYDENAYLRYRQHTQNMIGMNIGFKARMNRIKFMLDGKYQIWNTLNLKALSFVYADMTKQNQITFDRFKSLRKASLWKRLLLFRKSGIYRHTFLENLGLYLAILMGKI
jgi:glycosyltransferase involved in cell wall biosynthesis